MLYHIVGKPKAGTCLSSPGREFIILSRLDIIKIWKVQK